MEKIKTKNIKQVVTFRAAPHEIYALLMDSKKHAAFSGSEASIGKKVGSKMSAYGGWISGKNLKLIPDRLIVQSWRGNDWQEGHFSKVMFLITKTKTGSKLTFGQTGIPAQKAAHINTGWKTQYWDKMKVMLGEKKKIKNSSSM